MRRLWMAIFFLVVLSLCNTPMATAQFSEAGVEKLRVAVDAPDLTLKELGGKRISLKDLRGKIILLNFFATWCPHCRRESASFEKLHEGFKDTDLVVLKVATKEKEQDLVKYKNEFNISTPILIDGKGSGTDAYGVSILPETFFINRKGKILGRARREVDWASSNMKNLIQYLLKEKS
jgi:peroxiredoxin